MRKINLYNVCKSKNPTKTRNVINYINKLVCPQTFEHYDIVKFDNITREALNLVNPNDMLDKIGFNPTGQDGIFEECQRHKK